MKRFDRKFGIDFLSGLPRSPAVYLFKDEEDQVLYVGKAKDIRRRLSDYRNASRRKAHRKMRAIVRASHSVETRLQPSEADALLVENELIRELRPRFNVDGAFDFLYPAIGTGCNDGRILLCFTSQPERFEELDLRWHGAFRPRLRARQAFDTLTQLFGQLGHIEPRSRLPEAPRIKGSLLIAARRIPEPFLPKTREFLDGENDSLLETFALSLLEQQQARRDSASVQENLLFLADFYAYDVQRLKEARTISGRTRPFVPSAERDTLFIRAQHAADLLSSSQQERVK